MSSIPARVYVKGSTLAQSSMFYDEVDAAYDDENDNHNNICCQLLFDINVKL